MRFSALLTGTVLTCLALFGLVLPSAEARPRVSTKYTYYSVAASTADGLYRQMVSRGPHVSGRKAFAATTARTQHKGNLVEGGRRCQVNRYSISLAFTIKLPKLRRGVRLSKSVRSRWKKFAAFVKRHEERHRAIWIGCARTVERRVKAIKARTCAQADKKAAAIIASVRKSCNRQHDAFDASERARLKNHPLIRAARVAGKRRTKVVALRANTRVSSRKRRKIRRGRAAN